MDANQLRQCHSPLYDESFDPLEGQAPPNRLRVVIDSTDGDLIVICCAATELLRTQNIEVVIRGTNAKVSAAEAKELGFDVPPRVTNDSRYRDSRPANEVSVPEYVLPGVLWNCASELFKGKRDCVWSMLMLALFEGCDLCPHPVYLMGAGAFLAEFCDFPTGEALLAAPPTGTWLAELPFSHGTLERYTPLLNSGAFERLVCRVLWAKTPLKRRAATADRAEREGYDRTFRAWATTGSGGAASASDSKRLTNGTSGRRLERYFQHAYYALLYYGMYGWLGYELPAPEHFGWTLDEHSGRYVTATSQ